MPSSVRTFKPTDMFLDPPASLPYASAASLSASRAEVEFLKVFPSSPDRVKRGLTTSDHKQLLILAKWMQSLVKVTDQSSSVLQPNAQLLLHRVLGGTSRKPNGMALGVQIRAWKDAQEISTEEEPEESPDESEPDSQRNHTQMRGKLVFPYMFSKQQPHSVQTFQDQRGRQCSSQTFIEEQGLKLPYGASKAVQLEFEAAAIWLSKKEDLDLTLQTQPKKLIDTLGEMVGLPKSKRTSENILLALSMFSPSSKRPRAGEQNPNPNPDQPPQTSGTALLTTPAHLLGDETWAAASKLTGTYRPSDMARDKEQRKNIRSRQESQGGNSKVTLFSHQQHDGNKFAYSVVDHSFEVMIGSYNANMSAEEHGFWILRAMAGVPERPRALRAPVTVGTLGTTVAGAAPSQNLNLKRMEVQQHLQRISSPLLCKEELLSYVAWSFALRNQYYADLGFSTEDLGKISKISTTQQAAAEYLINEIFSDFSRRTNVEEANLWITTFVQAILLPEVKYINAFDPKTNGNGKSTAQVLRNDLMLPKPSPVTTLNVRSLGGQDRAAGSGARPADPLRKVFTPRSRWILGVRGQDLINWPSHAHQCKRCNQVQGAGPHATWECPQRFWELYGKCPGFDASGNRVANQWTPGGDLTPASRQEWKQLLNTNGITPHPHARNPFIPDFDVQAPAHPAQVGGAF